MSKLDVIEDILLHYRENDIYIGRKQIVGMFEALDINPSELVRLDPVIQEMIAEIVFSKKKRKRFSDNIDRPYYFANTLKRYYCVN